MVLPPISFETSERRPLSRKIFAGPLIAFRRLPHQWGYVWHMIGGGRVSFGSWMLMKRQEVVWRSGDVRYIELGRVVFKTFKSQLAYFFHNCILITASQKSHLRLKTRANLNLRCTSVDRNVSSRPVNRAPISRPSRGLTWLSSAPRTGVEDNKTQISMPIFERGQVVKIVFDDWRKSLCLSSAEMNGLKDLARLGNCRSGMY